MRDTLLVQSISPLKAYHCMIINNCTEINLYCISWTDLMRHGAGHRRDDGDSLVMLLLVGIVLRHVHLLLDHLTLAIHDLSQNITPGYDSTYETVTQSLFRYV